MLTLRHCHHTRKSLLKVESSRLRKKARVPEAERLAPGQNSALLGTHPGTTTRSVIPGDDDDDDDDGDDDDGHKGRIITG